MCKKLQKILLEDYFIKDRFKKIVEASIIYIPILFISGCMFYLSLIFSTENTQNISYIFFLTGKIFLSLYLGSFLQYILFPGKITYNLIKTLSNIEKIDSVEKEKLNVYLFFVALRVMFISAIIIGLTI